MRRFIVIIALAILGPLVSACQGTGALDLTPRAEAGASDANATPPANPSASAAQSGGQANALPVAAGDARIQFAPVIGATEEAVTPLSRRLSARAGERGLTLVTESTAATLLVKGYFSTIADDGRTTVIYVWDVLAPTGDRLHRIQGQQAVTGGQGTGWPSVTDETMQAIADRTIDELATWLSRSTG
ncbi:hypothetical protein [Nitratireductor sp. GCM10026969]|uniref:hypothetical protein n=1 Tax=Nitratireductor sp. GCM10026969 TaxID=3252645 RepID=UPI00361291C2